MRIHRRSSHATNPRAQYPRIGKRNTRRRKSRIDWQYSCRRKTSTVDRFRRNHRSATHRTRHFSQFLLVLSSRYRSAKKKQSDSSYAISFETRTAREIFWYSKKKTEPRKEKISWRVSLGPVSCSVFAAKEISSSNLSSLLILVEFELDPRNQIGIAFWAYFGPLREEPVYFFAY